MGVGTKFHAFYPLWFRGRESGGKGGASLSNYISTTFLALNEIYHIILVPYISHFRH